MTLEQAIAYIQDDELVEVTPEVGTDQEAVFGSSREEEAKPEGGGGLAILLFPSGSLIWNHKDWAFPVDVRASGNRGPFV